MMKGSHFTQRHRRTNPNLEKRVNSLSLVFPKKRRAPRPRVYSFKDYLEKKPSESYEGSDATLVANPNYKKTVSSYKKSA